MKEINLFTVCGGPFGEAVGLANCTTKEKAEKAMQRLVEANFEREDRLYILEETLVLDKILPFDDGDLDT